MEKLLTKFLDVGLLPHLANNEQVAFIESAIADVAKKLAKSRVHLITYTLVALHPDISKENSLIREVDEALKKHWKTIQNNISDEPRQIWRTIIWGALNQQAKDVTSAAVIWFTASSLLPYAELDANEYTVISEFLFSLRDKVETETVRLWNQSNQSNAGNPDLNFTLDKPEVKSVIDAAFKQELIKATGPNDKSGTALEGANQYSPASQLNYWSDTFAEQSAKAIGKRINSSAVNLTNDLYSQLGEFVEELKNSISQLSENLISENTYRQIRNELLWWRQTLYSPILRKGYRELDSAEVAFAAAADLHKLLSGVHPISVEYLLRETFKATAVEDFDKKFPLKYIVDKILADSDAKIISALTNDYYKNFSDSVPLLGIIKRSMNSGRIDEEDFGLLGLKSNTEITLPEFAIWMFRDLQAYRLANLK